MNANEKIVHGAMPDQTISVEVLREKYAKGDEVTVADVRRRVARALAAVESPEIRAEKEIVFYEALEHGFVPAGRINSAAGTDIKATLINCFVQPVGDSVSEYKNGVPGIYPALLQAAETMRRGGGVGYDFSEIRPAGALVSGTFSRASGPVSFMAVFDRSCSTVESAGARRGAQMGALRVDHPDILTFIHAKDKGDLTNFNISIGVTDAFMRAVERDEEVELWHAAEPHPDVKQPETYRREDGTWVYRKQRAREIWEAVMLSTYDHAEPGILFISRINEENNLHAVETIRTTNPCGEQPLPPYGCCDLGSVNLTMFVRNAFTDQAYFDFEGFKDLVRVGVRMLDLVLDATFWPLPEQRDEAMAKRRIGLGFLGLGSALVMLGIRYDSDKGCSMAAQISEVMRDEAYLASIELAKEKGAFPALEVEQYLESGFAKRLPEHIRAQIREHGIRNSHLLSIAPTGTITLAFADNASNGIEPAFSWTYNRKKRMADGTHEIFEVADHAYRLYRHRGGNTDSLPGSFVTALEMSAMDHLRMLQAVQPYIDTSISKTVNVPADYPYEDFQNLYFAAWKAGLKGLATYRPNSVLGSVLSVDAPAAPEKAVEVTPIVGEDPLRKQFDSRPAGDLEGVTSKVEYMTYEGKSTVYLTVNFMRVNGVVDGNEVEIERPVEFFMPAGQRNDGQQWITSNMRLLSMVARSGGSVAKALADMREVVWDKGTVRYGFFTKEDGTQVPMYHDSEVAALGYALQRILIKRGLLDADGNQVPVAALASRLARRDADNAIGQVEENRSLENGPVPLSGLGKKCPDCGAHELHKVDGCQKCGQCGYVGSCG
ncbi:adenosylcobalamin-dependent ribonucleoside-diphosphate reductase (plasmid) [Burkholderia vietnamiensis]|uniref:Vitamin B12-dependent ribonucleotide reductase n=1 Tax=Burkholderia vietnamiensis (strain G4 / LMG 22486) TaxID=269482 RepID=A4JTM7_BURVG|nr:ribonucleoside-diphosphate reductase, adenosylcobalamin-dependent [Burkholderia vietnamiensis G4]MCB4350210.1 adenosylcobalamin-dependent ribonucleoside-diphosphate reductase [Burkholderia vietnamiensis]